MADGCYLVFKFNTAISPPWFTALRRGRGTSALRRKPNWFSQLYFHFHINRPLNYLLINPNRILSKLNKLFYMVQSLPIANFMAFTHNFLSYRDGNRQMGKQTN